MRGRRLALLSAAMLLSLPAAAADLASHRAAYRLALESARAGGGVQDAAGAMLYEVVDQCDAWTSQQRFTLSLVGRDGTASERQSDYVTWESKDGRVMRFRLRQTVDGTVAQTIVGEARIGADGRGSVRYREPSEQELALPPGTLFPMIHTLRILAAAKAGQRTLAAPLFDGTSDEGANESNTAIIGAAQGAPSRFPALAALPSWRFRIAFFEPNNTSGSPDYEVGLRYWENGVADELTMDFGDFVVSGRLETLEIIPGGC